VQPYPIRYPRSAAQRGRGRVTFARAWTVVRVALGLLLVTAAALKLSGLNVTAIPRAGWFATPQVQVIAAEWELILGFWLLSGAYQVASAIAALVTFSLFAIISGYFGFIGVSHCGCFGSLRTSPWLVFVLDLVAVTAIVKWVPDISLQQVRMTQGSTTIFCGAASIFLGALAVTWIVYGSPAAALAKLRGASLTVEPTYLDFGDGKQGEVLEATVTVHNWAAEPAQLIGGTSDCLCVMTRDLPITIPSMDSRTLYIAMTIPKGNTRSFTRYGQFLTDRSDQPVIQLSFGCRVIQQPGSVSHNSEGTQYPKR
jgi:hypothetical protein